MEKSNNGNNGITVKLIPGVLSCYGFGWRKMWTYFLELFLISIISFLISMFSGLMIYPFSLFSPEMEYLHILIFSIGAGFFYIFTLAYNYLLSQPIEFGVSYSFLRASRDEKVEVKNMFEIFQNYWNVVLANILRGFIVGFGMVFFIVPGIIFICKLAFVPYIVVEKKTDVITAISESWRKTDGYAWKIFLLGLLAIPISIAGLIFFGVGIIISGMWIRASLASLYYAIDMKKDQES
ncbi:hypothetical protein KAW48_09570 [candidate division WOR-3 bacterium]|nr:hypothetical protein [candidate division WOR-3 bacterium]